MNKSLITDKHVKKVKFMLENEADNRPFEFTIKFNINRNKVIQKKIQPIDVSVVQAPTRNNTISLPSIVRGGGRFRFVDDTFDQFSNNFFNRGFGNRFF